MEPDLEEINNNASRIVANIEQESVDVYIFLKDQFLESNVSENYLFQFVFRSFYRLDMARLTAQFKKTFFEIMESNRNSKEFDIKGIVGELYKIPNARGSKSLQFSFTTKLMSTIDNNLPMYDSKVAGMYGFKAPYNYKPFEKRLTEYIDFYTQLKESYQKILKDDSLSIATSEFYEKISNAESLSKIKILDFIIWSAGKLKAKRKS